MDYESKPYRIAQFRAVIIENVLMTISSVVHFSIKLRNFVPYPSHLPIASKIMHKSMRIRQFKNVIKPAMEITLKISVLIQKSPLL
nr:MAG TPA: hypothetical protein [Bacteriophage sp.]